MDRISDSGSDGRSSNLRGGTLPSLQKLTKFCNDGVVFRTFSVFWGTIVTRYAVFVSR